MTEPPAHSSMSGPDAKQAEQHSNLLFIETRWSQVILASDHQAEGSHDALEKLCQSYWGPVYGFLRRKGKRSQDAEDLTQQFFLRLLKSDSFAAADKSKGRFRSFLLGALKHFLVDEIRKQTTQKRGGGERLQMDFQKAENKYRETPDPGWTPEQHYDQRWAATLLAKAYECLREEFEAAGQQERFEHFKAFLADEAEDGAYEPIASALGMSRGAISKAVQRMRIRYQQLVRREVAETVTSSSAVEAELIELFQ